MQVTRSAQLQGMQASSIHYMIKGQLKASDQCQQCVTSQHTVKKFVSCQRRRTSYRSSPVISQKAASASSPPPSMLPGRKALTGRMRLAAHRGATRPPPCCKNNCRRSSGLIVARANAVYPHCPEGWSRSTIDCTAADRKLLRPEPRPLLVYLRIQRGAARDTNVNCRRIYATVHMKAETVLRARQYTSQTSLRINQGVLSFVTNGMYMATSMVQLARCCMVSGFAARLSPGARGMVCTCSP